MKIALVHVYLTQRGVAERVFELLCKHFPTVDIYTSIHDRKNTIELGDRQVRTTFLQNIPINRKYFHICANLLPSIYSLLRERVIQDKKRG